MSQFKIKRIFSSRSDSMPELKIKWVKGSKLSLQDMFWNKLMFKLNDRRTKRRKVRTGATNSKPGLHFEAQIDMLNGKPWLDSEEMSCLKNELDSNGDGKISTAELKGVTISPVSKRSLFDNHARDKDATKYMSSEDIFFQDTPEQIIMGQPGPGTIEFNTDIVSIGIDDDGNVISFISPQETQEIDNKFVSGSLKSEVEAG